MIKINDEYFIDATPNCYILLRFVGNAETSKEKNEKQKKKNLYDTLGYYPTIEGALNGIIKTETRKFIGKEDINTLKDLLKKVTEVRQVIEKACEGLEGFMKK